MIYLIEIGETAQKQISKLKDRILQKNIKNKIKQLKYNPKKGRHLFKNCYELKANNYRVYYKVYRGIIVVEQIKYSGKVKIEKLGTKNSQKRDLKFLR